ncbi:Pickpocket protein 28 [Frankliniella fusca]|uniref:Pickpocket protein 28 n=1 Tax=Frankliniella fusca TaxID=407009 RepID=A0AAE1I3H7_9NEOP|nr:Pickpocket protein 28 [Frankliniella fusca]
MLLRPRRSTVGPTPGTPVAVGPPVPVVEVQPGAGGGEPVGEQQPRRGSRTAGAFLVQCLRQSSIHGMGHISTDGRRHPLERILWALVVALAWYGTYLIARSTWRRFQDNPTVISLERDYMSWNTSFPALTLCPNVQGRRDPPRVEAAVRALTREFGVQNQTALREFVERLTEASLYTLGEIPDSQGIPGDRFLAIIENVGTPDRSGIKPYRRGRVRSAWFNGLRRCAGAARSQVALPWNFSVVASLGSDLASAAYDPSLVPTMTELGLCFAFNSVLARYVSPRYGVPDLTTRLQLFVHGPGEVPDLQSPSLVAAEGHFKNVQVTALGIHTSAGARRLSPEQRRCRFTDEPEAGAGAGPRLDLPVYSYNLCRRACRARRALDTCGCVPHLYGPMSECPAVPRPTVEAERDLDISISP